MAIRMVPCRHIATGAEAEIPETALKHFADYVPVDAEPEPPASEPAAPEPETEAATPRARKKAASPATTEEE